MRATVAVHHEAIARSIEGRLSLLATIGTAGVWKFDVDQERDRIAKPPDALCRQLRHLLLHRSINTRGRPILEDLATRVATRRNGGQATGARDFDGRWKPHRPALSNQ
eukprot:7435257-Pyramimonas_sp.AAC.1